MSKNNQTFCAFHLFTDDVLSESEEGSRLMCLNVSCVSHVRQQRLFNNEDTTLMIPRYFGHQTTSFGLMFLIEGLLGVKKKKTTCAFEIELIISHIGGKEDDL